MIRPWLGLSGRISHDCAPRVRQWSAAVVSPVLLTNSQFDKVTPFLPSIVKHAKPVELTNIGVVVSPYVGSQSVPVLESVLSPRDHFRLGQEVRASVQKTHSLGLLMTVTASCVQDVEAEQEEVRFTGLMSHLEIDFYRKSVGRGMRLDETYSVYVQNLTADGHMRLSFRPGVRDRLVLGKDAILEALAATDNGRIPVGEASSPEDIRTVFLGLSKGDFKRALGSLYREHRIERPAGRVFTQQTTEETRMHLLSCDEAVESVNVTVRLQNLPPSIKKATLARHVIAHINNRMHDANLPSRSAHDSCSGSVVRSEAAANDKNVEKLGQMPMKGLEVAIEQLSLHTKSITRRRQKAISAVLCLQVSGTASRLDRVAGQVVGAEGREVALGRLAVRLLSGLGIGRRVTVQEHKRE